MADMLVSYDLSCKYNGLTKEYTLKFKVAKGVKVSFSQSGDINKIDLTIGSVPGGDHSKKYKVTGPLKVQFFQYPVASSAKASAPPPPDPSIDIEP